MVNINGKIFLIFLKKLKNLNCLINQKSLPSELILNAYSMLKNFPIVLSKTLLSFSIYYGKYYCQTIFKISLYLVVNFTTLVGLTKLNSARSARRTVTDYWRDQGAALPWREKPPLQGKGLFSKGGPYHPG